jgi:hypothetical protein
MSRQAATDDDQPYSESTISPARPEPRRSPTSVKRLTWHEQPSEGANEKILDNVGSRDCQLDQ